MASTQGLVLDGPLGWTWLYTLLRLFLSYLMILSLYRALIHPLSKHPGPKLWGMTRIPYDIYLFRGTLPFKIAEFHKKYGPVVRIAPNELSYITEDAWNDIYSRQPGGIVLEKNPLLAPQRPSRGIHGLFTTKSEQDHARMRRNFSYAFSEKAIREQEPIMNTHFDLLIQGLRRNCSDPVNFVKWYNYTTIDIIGDLTFGESFRCLENTEMQRSMSLFFKYLKAMVVIRIMQRFWPVDEAVMWLSAKLKRSRNRYGRGLFDTKLDKRLAMDTPRPDFMSYAREHLNTPKGMNIDELRSTAAVLIVAGSETTATLLSAVTYHLLKNPRTYQKLVSEIRSTFQSQDQITITSATNLPYLLAVLDEGLRIFPPTPSGQQRITPPQGHTITGGHVPGRTIVYVHQWSAYHSAANFRDPDAFVPERWLGDPKYEGDRRQVVHPFSMGPRNCIGMNLAYAEMRVILARVLWNFDLELCEESREWAERLIIYQLWVKEPLMVRVTPVKRE